MGGFGRWLGRQARSFRADVVDRPVVGPLAAWVILSFIGLIAWLTWLYAAGVETPMRPSS